MMRISLKNISMMSLLTIFLLPAFAQDIHDTVQKGDLTQIKALLEKNPDLVKARNERGCTPLHIAASIGREDLVAYLIEKGADVHARENNEETPLFWSTWPQGSYGAAKLLLTHGADVNASSSGYRPIHYASRNGQTKTVELFIAHGADINVRTDDDGSTPLHKGVFLGRKETAALLIDKGAEIDIGNNTNNSPLFTAVMTNRENMVELLVEKGAKLNVRNKYGRTPLHRAAIAGSTEITNFLLSHGAQVNDRDENGRTPLYFAGKYGHKTTSELLIKKGGKSDVMEENFGFSPLLKKKLNDGEAVIWYLYACGWAVKTKSRLLIFDYWESGDKPADPYLANGHIVPEEIRDLDVFVFVSHDHFDHYDKKIFDWEREVSSITYVFGWQEREGPNYVCMEGKDRKEIKGLDIMTVRADHGQAGGVAFLVKIDGLQIYHSGDHSSWGSELRKTFKEGIDSFSESTLEIDIAFISHYGEGSDRATLYTIEKLLPHVVFPQHSWGTGEEYKAFLPVAAQENLETTVLCAENRGDRFFYRHGKIM